MASKNQINNVTIYDVAKYVGCSSATVSLALKNDSRISDSTKDKIKEAVSELQYKPNFFAKVLKQRCTYTIGVIVPDLRNPVFAEIISGIEDFLAQKNYHILIGVTDMKLNKEKYYLNMVSRYRVDGMILMPTFIDELKPDLGELMQSNYPFVLAGITCDDISINTVSSNIIDGAFIAVDHLIAKGHKNIAFISGQVSPEQSRERIIGYKKALSIYGIPFNTDYIVTCDQNVQVVREKVKEFLINHKEVTALFCLCDFVAMAAMKAIYDNHLKVPDDIAIIGYDNIAINDYYMVGLTSVDSNNRKIGEMSARMVLNLINGSQDKTEHIMLIPKLVEREST